MARGAVENRPRYRLALEHGALAVMAAADLELGYAGAKVYVGFAEGARFEVLLFRADAPELVAVIDADKLGQLRTGAASGVAAKHLARSGAATLGVIGCGWQAETQVECIRAAVPTIERTVAYCRTRETLEQFCERFGCEPGESNQRRGRAATSSSPSPARATPSLRGEWLRPGALVCAVGANDGRRRELDNVVLERAAFVCCDSVENAQARVRRPDRAGRRRRARLARGARAAAGRRAASFPAASRTTTSSSSSRTGSRRGTSPPPRASAELATAR